MKKSLFPISLGNDTFSTNVVVPAISRVAEQYDEITVLIADDIQIYNHIVKYTHDDDCALPFERAEMACQKTFRDREVWFNRLKLHIGERGLNTKWRLASIGSFVDKKTYQILRRVSILFDSDNQFRSDVEDAAHKFILRRRAQLKNSDFQFKMSQRYIVEEIAISLRAKVIGGIDDEFYIGETSIPIEKLYTGRYRATPYALCGKPEAQRKFRFFEYGRYPANGGEWKQI